MEYTVLVPRGLSLLLLLLDEVLVVVGFDVNVYGATLIISGPDNEPATRCVRRVDDGIVRCGRDSL